MRYLACLLIAVCLWARPAAAHPNGASKIDLILTSDSVQANVEVKPDDIVNVTHVGDVNRFTTLPEYLEASDKIAYYMETRVELKFDGNSAPVKVLQYRKQGDIPGHKIEKADFLDTALALRFGWRIPAGAKKLSIDSKMFAEFEIQPLCHVRIFYQGKEIRHKFLGLDDGFTIPLSQDSLESMLAAAQQPAPAPGQVAPPQAQPEESVVGRFLWLGFTHILPEGTDHILFVLGLFFFSTFFRPLLIQITAFTIAHSITLGLSLFGVFSLPSHVVEPLIALSIAVVAIENIFFRKLRPSRFLIVFGFGLIHGLGFAGVLKSLGLPPGQFLKVLVSFNLGVEAGQLTVVAIAAALTAWMWKKPWYFKRVVIPVSAVIATVGLFWFVQRIVHPGF